jgi:hypothetical protein
MGVRDTIAKAVMGIKAYHGSPHSFDRFDASKIGSGEGAQAYGYGHYFAENPKVAHGYAERLGTPTIGGVPFDANIPSHYLTEAMGPKADRAKWLHTISNDLEQMRQMRRPGDARQIENYAEMERILRSGEPIPDFDPLPGHRYEVNIKADPAQMLDWDKALREQQGVIDKLPPTFIDDVKKEAYSRALSSTSKPRSDQLWGMVKDPLTAPGGFGIDASKYMRGPETSAALSERGIPGIKYLDAMSRGATEGTSNYVMFPGTEDLISISRKYAIPGAVGAGTMGATFDERYYGAQP